MNITKQQRREYEKWLKKNDPEKYKEWKAGSIKRGLEIHNQNVERNRQLEAERYEERQTLMIQKLRSQGLNDAEIDRRVEDWVSTIKLWNSK